MNFFVVFRGEILKDFVNREVVKVCLLEEVKML